MAGGILLRRYLHDWPALARWQDSGYLARAAGDAVVEVELYGRDFERRIVVERTERMPFRTFMEWTDDPSALRPYLPCEHVIEKSGDAALAKLADDIAIPDYFDRRVFKDATFLCGRDTLTQFHYHFYSDAMLCQVVGKKRIVLLAANERRLPFPPWWRGSQFSSRRFSSADDAIAFLEHRRAEFEVHELTPGDALVIPPHAPHLVEGPSYSVSVSFWWDAPLRRVATSALPRALLAAAIHRFNLSRKRRLRAAHQPAGSGG